MFLHLKKDPRAATHGIMASVVVMFYFSSFSAYFWGGDVSVWVRARVLA